MATAVKFASESDGILRILAIPFGGPEELQGSDLDGERFTKSTNLCLDLFPDSRPLLYDHGHDDTVQLEPVGYFKSASIEVDDEGYWIDAQLNKSSQYFAAVTELVKRKKLFSSSGAIGHLVKTAKNGDIEIWPWAEQSLTVHPSNYLSRIEHDKVAAHYKSANIDLPEIDAEKAALTTDERDALSDSDYAYIDSKGGKHLPVHDAPRVRNAMSRFGQTKFESPAKKKSAAKKIIAAAKRLKISINDTSAVAEAAKFWDDLFAATRQDDIEEAKSWVKLLQESVDTSGGYLVPEDTTVKDAKPKKKKPTLIQKKKGDAANDADDDDADDTNDGKALDFKEVFDLFYDNPALAAEFLATHKAASESSKTVHESEQVVAIRQGEQILMLVSTGERKSIEARVKSGEIIPAVGRYGDPVEGSVEDWLSDLRRGLNRGLWGGLMEGSGYCDILATFGYNGPGYAIVCLHTYDDDEVCYYKITFDADDNNEPIVSAAEAYTCVYMPVDAATPADEGDDDDMGKSAVPYALHSAFLIKAAAAYSQRTEGLVEKRVEEGRDLSVTNREHLGKVIESLDKLTGNLRTVHSGPAAKAKAELARLKQRAEMQAIQAEAELLLTKPHKEAIIA